VDNNISDLEEVVMTELDEKQDTLTAEAVPRGYNIMQNGIVRALKAVSPAWLAPDVNHMEFGLDLNNYATNATVALKANQATTYTKTAVDTALNLKASQSSLDATNAAVALKANQSTTYTKTEVDTQFSNLIDSAPAALNTVKELANFPRIVLPHLGYEVAYRHRACLAVP
jgi:hypothetical protein